MTAPGEPCRTCRGTRLIETAAVDSRAIHYEPCPDCSGPAPGSERDAGRRLWEALHAALGVDGYLDHWWQFSWDELPGDLQGELADAALRLGVMDQEGHDDESNEDWREQADRVGWR